MVTPHPDRTEKLFKTLFSSTYTDRDCSSTIARCPWSIVMLANPCTPYRVGLVVNTWSVYCFGKSYHVQAVYFHQIIIKRHTTGSHHRSLESLPGTCHDTFTFGTCRQVKGWRSIYRIFLLPPKSGACDSSIGRLSIVVPGSHSRRKFHRRGM